MNNQVNSVFFSLIFTVFSLNISPAHAQNYNWLSVGYNAISNEGPLFFWRALALVGHRFFNFFARPSKKNVIFFREPFFLGFWIEKNQFLLFFFSALFLPFCFLWEAPLFSEGHFFLCGFSFPWFFRLFFRYSLVIRA